MPTWDSSPRTALLLDNHGQRKLREGERWCSDVVTRIGQIHSENPEELGPAGRNSPSDWDGRETTPPPARDTMPLFKSPLLPFVFSHLFRSEQNVIHVAGDITAEALQ